MTIATTIVIGHPEAREGKASNETSNLQGKPSDTYSASTDTAGAFAPKLAIRKIRLEQGDTLLKMLSDTGVPSSEANTAISALTKKMNLRKLQVGQLLHLYLLPRTTPNHPFQLIGLILDQGREKKWTLYRDIDYRFSAQLLPFPLAKKTIASVLARKKLGPDGRFSKEVVLGRGDTLISLLRAAGADYQSATLASREMGKQLDLRKLWAGQSVALTFEHTDQHKSNLRLMSVTVEIDASRTATISRSGNGTFLNPSSSSSPPGQATTKPSDDSTNSSDQETSTTLTSTETLGKKSAPGNDQKFRPKNASAEQVIWLTKGDILFDRILSLGANRSDTHDAIAALRKHIDLRRLHVGQKIAVFFYVHRNGTRNLVGINIPRKGRKMIEVSYVIGKGFLFGPPEPKLLTANFTGTTPIPEASSVKLSGPNSQNDSTQRKITSPQEAPLRVPENRRMQSVRINRGDTLSGLLKRAGSPNLDAKHALQSMREVYNPDLIRIGQNLVAEFDVDGHRRRLVGMVLGIDRNTAVVVELNGKQFEARKTSGKALAGAINLAERITAARSALATGIYTAQTRELYGFDTAESDLVDLQNAERVRIALEPGDTLFEAILDAGAPRLDANAAIAATKKILDPRKLKAGQHLALAFVADPDVKTSPNKKSRGLKLAELAIDLSTEQRLRVARLHDGAFVSGLVQRPLTRELRRASGTIQNNLYKTAASMGLPAEVLVKLIRVFSYDVDFQRDIRRGDHFEALYESYTDEDGEMVRGSTLLYASMTLSGAKLPLFQFTVGDGLTDYFDEDGQSARKALMRTPIDGARLTSSYGKRKHPTLGYSKMHRGVDFGAPKGTPIFAAGDGIVAQATRNGAYGKYIRLRHGTKYQTAYAHLSKYAKSIRRGERVKQGQIIGFVGSTGRSTGPHLHYEVLVNQKQVNPLGVKLPTGLLLKGDELAKFKNRRDQLRAAYASVPKRQTLADQNNPD